MDLIRNWTGRLLISVFLWASHSPEALAKVRPWETDLPLYEVGLAGAVFYLQDYPAADQGRLRALALPYVYYRGKVLRADDEGGIRGKVMEKDRIEFDLSASAAFPANSEDNKARGGMPDLDWIGEVGPRLRVHIMEDENVQLDFNMPVRYVFSTDFTRMDDRGYLFQPQLALHVENVWQEEWDLTFLFSAQFASDQLMDYFYEVPAEFATPERPSFQAKGGLLGNNLVVGVSREVKPKFTVFCGIKVDYYGLSVNRRSPLFKDPWNSAFAVGFSYQMYESVERAGDWF